MKKIYIKILLLLSILLLSFNIVGENKIIHTEYTYHELIYDDVWGTIYNPVVDQCNENPTITGDGSIINITTASELRWIAISQDMLNCNYRSTLLKDDNRFNGKLRYGDTILIQSPHKKINGWWVVRDAKNKRYSNSIDFLQTTGDGNLYDNNSLWSGKFKNIKIFKIIKTQI
jgi:hypothetical protein